MWFVHCWIVQKYGSHGRPSNIDENKYSFALFLHKSCMNSTGHFGNTHPFKCSALRFPESLPISVWDLMAANGLHYHQYNIGFQGKALCIGTSHSFSAIQYQVCDTQRKLWKHSAEARFSFHVETANLALELLLLHELAFYDPKPKGNNTFLSNLWEELQIYISKTVCNGSRSPQAEIFCNFPCFGHVKALHGNWVGTQAWKREALRGPLRPPWNSDS